MAVRHKHGLLFGQILEADLCAYFVVVALMWLPQRILFYFGGPRREDASPRCCDLLSATALGTTAPMISAGVGEQTALIFLLARTMKERPIPTHDAAASSKKSLTLAWRPGTQS